ncbi:biotin/lipoyl-binding protein [Pseudonocardia sp. KRD-184]|uniref:Biotin/lipoyl-binding protein n=1 Tax=Pseudonocardia oceani TaxID=2792013 RepID=A0ABS6UAP9_9PSEU|nr:biotin/lipoyl-binding protein [Pseudonocardia oceani]MBW0089920.1 biotin/lipoyl-binding protein [Pseudonocardia oceani]MBW0094764.1 biotin/lipoyl-binding protein [Pseudonocardia oceani]MBW0109715.1 biotin/lipoyl-binding protein [Pseudonocardia oceani]MBW0120272.1 biotin/lipoyl-binding protein [Pseudonocardia oceani]MBW0128996.1 biotin/lipoyl-binding protein [Pseudonocardia oceani]
MKTVAPSPLRIVAAVGAVLALAACSGEAAPPPVVRVDRGLVATTVSASGSLVAITEQNLGFAEGGQLAEVLVAVGDRVQAGDVLARLENFDLEQALEQSRAQLDQARANLAKITGATSVEQAQASLDQAYSILSATEEQVEATNSANDVATERARVQLDFDRDQLDRAQDQLARDRAGCSSSPAPTTTKPAPTSSSGLLGGAEGQTATTPVTVTPDPECEAIPADETAVQQARGTVIASETALDTAEQRENVDEASGRLSIENARNSVVTAQNTLDQAGSDRPADTDAQEAQVRDAEASVALAQRDLDDTALRAPVAGVVSQINGTVGEFVGAASGTTSLAPGSSARLPGVTDSSSTGASAATGGGGAFLVLNDVDSFQLVVPFEESDAARVQPGQAVDVTVDAVPGISVPASVLAVAPTGADVSGIVNYYATVVLNRTDPQLRDGQTADAAVRVESVENVLRVPSSTVRSEDGRKVVTTPGVDGGDPVTTPFSAGAVGDEYTEVKSGLREGQEVLLPQAQVASVPGGPPQN